MPTPPYAKLLVSRNGGAAQSGGITANHSDSIQLSGESTSGWTAQRWEIYEFPDGFTVPAGWSTDGVTGAYYSTAVTPPAFALPAGASLWGKYMLRLTVNNGLKDGAFDPTLKDEATALSILSSSGLIDTASKESTQFSTKGWVQSIKANWRALQTLLGSSVESGWEDAGTRVQLRTPTDTVAIGASAMVGTEKVLIEGGNLLVRRAGIAAGAVLAGLVLSNPDVATTGGAGDLSKNSPAVVLHSETFDTGVRRDNWVRVQSRPVGGGTPGQHLFVSMAQTLQSGGFTADTATLTDVLEVTPTLTSLLGSGNALAIGASPATLGAIRLPTGSANGLYAGTANRLLAALDTDVLLIGFNEVRHYYSAADVADAHTFAVGGVNQFVLTSITADFQDNNVVTTATVQASTFTARYDVSDVNGTAINLVKTNSGGAVQNGDTIGNINFYGDDGTSELVRAQINVACVGSVGTGDVPMQLVVWTGGTALSARTIWSPTGTQTHNCDSGSSYQYAIDSVNQYTAYAGSIDFRVGVNADYAIRGNGEAMIGLNIAASGVRNIALFNDGSAAMNSMDGGIYIANAVAVPTADPSGGGYLYFSGGELYTRTASGIKQLTP